MLAWQQRRLLWRTLTGRQTCRCSALLTMHAPAPRPSYLQARADEQAERLRRQLERRQLERRQQEADQGAGAGGSQDAEAANALAEQLLAEEAEEARQREAQAAKKKVRGVGAAWCTPVYRNTGGAVEQGRLQPALGLSPMHAC